ncbi:MAG TPA: hypothetical protein V6C90_29000 [Coleofasciculaceae cyanobacterium]
MSEAKGSAQYDWIAAIGDQQENISVRNICGLSHPERRSLASPVDWRV